MKDKNLTIVTLDKMPLAEILIAEPDENGYITVSVSNEDNELYISVKDSRDAQMLSNLFAEVSLILERNYKNENL